ncbi:hypothetical protein Avbf_01756 [Armadillidium vulgare]|nr:hypothetical protein Avbf_01756 [Armadillidium vulgare]
MVPSNSQCIRASDMCVIVLNNFDSKMDSKFKIEIEDEPLKSFDDKTLSNLVFAQVSGLEERIDYSSVNMKVEIDIKDDPFEINIKNEFETKDELFDDEMEGTSDDQVFAQISRLNEMMSPKRALWSENDLVSAVQAVERGLLSTYKAAERYKVPRRTIRNHLQTGSLKKTLGRKSILSDDQETELVNRIMRFSEMPVTPLIVRRLVFKFCELNNIKHNFNPSAKVAGNDWFKSFMKRHPEISRRKAQFMNPARAQKLKKFIVDDHFKRLSEVYDNLDLKSHPERIYNMDEKGCCLTIHHQQTVLAKKRAKRVHLQSSEHAESVTIAGCVNALGIAIPPMIIFKGRRLKPELYDNLPQGTLVQKSRKGYMTNELFKDFLKHLAQYKSSGKCLLIFD